MGLCLITKQKRPDPHQRAGGREESEGEGEDMSH